MVDFRYILQFGLLSIFVTACGALLTGCSPSNLGAEVAGTVTLDGTPIGPGVVIFAPVGGKENPATGAIQPNGTFNLKTSRAEGLPPGSYEVAVQINEIPADIQPGARDMRPSKSRIPQKYSSVSTSGLKFEVAPGANTISLDLSNN